MNDLSFWRNLSTKKHHWAILFSGVFLAGLIGFMMVSNYRSQVALQQSAFNQIKQDLSRQASVIEFFFVERRHDLKEIASSKELQTFFENRALGMSLSYGLKASLFDIHLVFQQLLEKRQIAGSPVYTRMSFVDDTGKILVDTQLGILPSAPAAPIAPIIPEDIRIIFDPLPYPACANGISNLFFKNIYVGQIRSWIPLNKVFFHHFVKHLDDSPTRGHFLFTKNQILSGDIPSEDLPVLQNDSLDQTPLDQQEFFTVFYHNAANIEMLAIGSKISGTPFHMLRVLPRPDVMDGMLPWQLVLLLGLLTVLVIGGLMTIWVLNSKSLALHIHLTESTAREEAILQKHHQLESEIAHRIIVEKSLRNSEKKYKDMFDHITDFIYTHDLQGRFLTVNPKAVNLLGYQPMDMIGRSMADFMPSELRPEFYNTFLPKIVTDGSHQGISVFIAKNGTRHEIEYTSSVVMENNEAVYIRGSGHDVTEFKRAEAILLENQTHLKTIMDSIRAGIVIVDQDTFQIVDANSYTLEKLHVSLEEIRGQSCRKYFSYLNSDSCPFNHSMITGSNYECGLLTRDGMQIPIMKTVIPLQRDGKEYLLESFLDISESKRHETELMHLKEAAEATSRELAQSNEELNNAIEMANRMALEAEMSAAAKGNFLANMSHEIRTPLNAIIGMADLLAETVLTENQREYVSIFQSSGENLLHLINDILDLSKIEAGNLQFEDIEFDLAELISDIGAMLQVQSHGKGLESGWSMHPDVPAKLIGDPGRLRQILLNLIGNALKFTEKGSITLSVQSIFSTEPVLPDPQTVILEFSVRDTGIGIPKNNLHTIFNAFTQMDASITRRFGGTGLGLTISKKLVELMGGTLHATSRVGQGSDFRFTVRLRSQAVISSPRIAGPVSTNVSTPDSPVLKRLAPCQPDAGENQVNRRVLLVEDIEHNRILVQAYLKASEWHLTMAQNGLEAVEHHQKELFDLILMDMQMPVMDGYTATQTIRQHETQMNLPRVPIIALTAHAFKDDIKKCLDCGCDAYLSKPIRKETLLNTMIQILDECSTRPVPVSPDPDIHLPLPVVPFQPLEEADDDQTDTPIFVTVDPDLAPLIPDFLQSIRDQIPHLSTMLDQGKYADIQNLGHSLKGVGGGYGFQKITELGAIVEQSARNRQHDAIHQAIVELQDYLDRVQIIGQPS